MVVLVMARSAAAVVWAPSAPRCGDTSRPALARIGTRFGTAHWPAGGYIGRRRRRMLNAHPARVHPKGGTQW